MADALGKQEERWQRRLVASWLIRVAVFCTPVIAGVLAGRLVGSALPPPVAGSEIVMWWLLVLGAATIALVLVERGARRLLPLAWLLRMALLFPTKAPRRWKMAVQVGTVRNLEQQVTAARAVGHEDSATSAAQKIVTLITALQAHDRHTRGHAERVRVYTDMLTAELGLAEPDRERLRWAALLHDIGKLAVTPDLLNKPGRPDAAEWEILERHPEEGARFCGPLLDWLGPWGDTIIQHHERYDGGGYPAGLAGEDIGLGARIVSVPDAYEVMTAPRPYKRAMTARAARQELADHAGTQFDPSIVRAFLNLNIRRLGWVAGPAAWVAQLPFIPRISGVDPKPIVAAAGVIAGFAMLGLQIPQWGMQLVEEPAQADAAERSDDPTGTFVVLADEAVEDPQSGEDTTPPQPDRPTSPDPRGGPGPIIVRPARPDRPGGQPAPPPDPAPRPDPVVEPAPEPEPEPEPPPVPEPTQPPDPEPTLPPDPEPTATPTQPPPPAPAVAVADAAMVSARETTTIAVLANDGGDLAGAVVTILNQPQHGTATAVGGAVVYTAQPGWTGVVVFDYQVCGVAGPCSSAPVTITVVR